MRKAGGKMPTYADVTVYPGHTIKPLKTPDTTGVPNQRGPSCGFYALGYVMGYWYERTSAKGAAVGKPLPPRTEMDDMKLRDQPRSDMERDARMADADEGRFTSLRQYGKYHNFTQYGSVFNAEAIVRIAQGASNGDFSGHVVVTRDEQQLIDKVKALIDKRCPVIIPYDVSVEDATAGDPVLDSGKAAHWTTIVGYDEDAGSTLWFLHYTWGSYYRSLASAFASSCRYLTSNLGKDFIKCEIRISDDRGKTWDVVERDWKAQSRVEIFERTKIGATFDYAGDKWKKVSETRNETECCNTGDANFLLRFTRMKPGTNMEYCDPDPDWSRELDFSKILYPDYYKKNFVNPGLRGKLVVVYPSAQTDKFR
jgi:hypothetical protein